MGVCPGCGRCTECGRPRPQPRPFVPQPLPTGPQPWTEPAIPEPYRGPYTITFANDGVTAFV